MLVCGSLNAWAENPVVARDDTDTRQNVKARGLFRIGLKPPGTAPTHAAAPPLLESPPPLLSQTNLLSEVGEVFVRDFRFEGNTVFSDAELGRVVEKYKGRKLGIETLEEARRLLTLRYINAGYINSGAVLNDQSVSEETITYQIIEGRLSEIEVEGVSWRGTNHWQNGLLGTNHWLRTGYVEKRIRRWDGPPLNMTELRSGLQVLREDPNIEQINAELKPGVRPGESVLHVQFKEPVPYRLGIEIDNERPPSVGAEEISLLAAHRNLTGNGDALSIEYGIAHSNDDPMELSGVDNVSGSYMLPVNSYDTTIEIHGEKSDDAVLEEPFLDLDIDSESYTVGASIRHPVFRNANREIAVSLGFDRRHSETFLFGKPFSLSAGADKGEMNVSVFRFTQEWTERGMNQVIAFRSTFNFGVDIFGATDEDAARDGRFISWVGQAQYVRRLFGTRNQLILKVSGQMTEDPLLSLEQFSVGGAYTVRGYRENQLVRDRGILASAEVRLPVWQDKEGNSIVQVAPFFDFGAAENAVAPNPGPYSLYSAGAGILLDPCKYFHAQLYWGYAFRDTKTSDDDIQDLGLHFRINLEAF